MIALRETFGSTVRSNLLIRRGNAVPPVLAAAADEVLVYPTTTRWSLEWWRERISKRLFRHDVTAGEFLKRNKIDTLVFGDAPAGSNLPIIGLIPDFQPFCFPQFFAPGELAQRREEVRRVGEKSTRLIAYAEPVRADMAKFAPQYVHKTRIVTPVSEIPASVYDHDPREVVGAYHLPDKFLYIPNQFWQHKNHSLVLEALAVLRSRHVEPMVVMTGLFHDHRSPEFSAGILRKIAESGLRGQVALLGLVPREHVYALMRQAIAVINPSLFEGYGMTVAETRWLGKRALLSDIPAHRVQDPPLALFFDPGDAGALALLMERAWNEFPAGPDLALEQEARQAYPAHKRACAQEFMNVVEEIVRK